MIPLPFTPHAPKPDPLAGMSAFERAVIERLDAIADAMREAHAGTASNWVVVDPTPRRSC